MIFGIFLSLFFGGFFVFLLFWYLRNFNTEKETDVNTNTGVNQVVVKEKEKGNVKDKKKMFKPESKFQYQHKWLLTTLKGHSGLVHDIDISSNGRHLVSVGSDRSLYLWKLKELWQKEKRFIRGSISLDTAMKIKFSPDDKAVIVSLERENTIRVIKIQKDDNSYSFVTHTDFSKDIAADIINIGIASNGNFIMTCHSNTTIGLWSLKGDLLHMIDTGNMVNYFAMISPCGRFIASSGFVSDARVWHVEFDKSKNFKQVTRAFELKGHKSSIFALSFTADSTKVVTASKDGIWKLWNINVDFRFQEPILLCSGSFFITGDFKHSHLSVSANGECLLIAQDKQIAFIDTAEQKVDEVLEDVHADPITAIAYEPRNKLFLSAGGKHINVYNDVVSRKVEIRNLKEKLRKTTDEKQQKQRLNVQIKEAEKCLNDILMKE